MSDPTWTILGTNDEAEAQSEQAAILAAHTLVDDGNRRAVVIGPTGRWVGEGERDDAGRWIYRTTQGRNRV